MNFIRNHVRPGLKDRVEAILEELKCSECEGWGYDHASQMIDSIIIECEKCHGTGINGMPLLKAIEGPTTQWVWNPETNTLGNPKYGQIQVMAVCDPVTGAMRYEAPVYTEGRGEIDVVVNDEGKIALVVQNRPVMIPAKILNQKWGKEPPKTHYLSIRQGMTMVEMPRGFNQGVMQEGEEETGYKILASDVIGNINSNTAVFGTSPIIAVGKAWKIESDMPPDPGEKILKVLWAEPEEIREADLICGFTVGALWKFRAWALKQKDPFWRKIGEKL